MLRWCLWKIASFLFVFSRLFCVCETESNPGRSHVSASASYSGFLEWDEYGFCSYFAQVVDVCFRALIEGLHDGLVLTDIVD